MKQRPPRPPAPAREAASGHATGRMATAPRVQRQARQIASQFGPVAQRVLMVRESKSDELASYTPEQQVGTANLYARRLADDAQVEVTVDEGGKAALMNRLKQTEVDGAKALETLQQRLIADRFWTGLTKEGDIGTLCELLKTESQSEPEDNETPKEFVDAMAADYPEATGAFVQQKAAALGVATTVGAATPGSIPLDWQDVLAEILYDLTRDRLIPEQRKQLTPYLPPFKALIGDINQGRVTGFDFVEKWNRPNSGPGAEFTVSAPGPLADKYDGQAVLHTHYAASNQAPNYAHTKPEAQKGALGYGYTVVDLAEAKKAPPVGKKHDEL